MPPSPNSLTGVHTDNPPLSMNWQYPAASQDSIIGYRLYRSSNGGDFTRIADEFMLIPTVKNFEDASANPTCSQAYYVVAVYLDSFGQSVETPPSANSWYSQKCN